jgi:hypothetical protein
VLGLGDHVHPDWQAAAGIHRLSLRAHAQLVGNAPGGVVADLDDAVARTCTANKPKPFASHSRSHASIPVRVCSALGIAPSPIQRMTCGSALIAAIGATSSSRHRRRISLGVSRMITSSQ